MFIFFNIFKKINQFLFHIRYIHLDLFKSFFIKVYFITTFYKRSELVLQEGLLIDFLQKKSFDLWVKKFLIYSSYLFNERLLFEKIVKFFISLILNPLQKFSIFEYLNISNLFFINVFFFIFLLFLIFFLFLIFLIF